MPQPEGQWILATGGTRGPRAPHSSLPAVCRTVAVCPEGAVHPSHGSDPWNLSPFPSLCIVRAARQDRARVIGTPRFTAGNG